jgi:hypothetical protein
MYLGADLQLPGEEVYGPLSVLLPHLLLTNAKYVNHIEIFIIVAEPGPTFFADPVSVKKSKVPVQFKITIPTSTVYNYRY